MRTMWIVGAAGAALMCAVDASAANATPMTIARPISTEKVVRLVGKAARCWRRNGRRYCERVRQTDRGYGYGLSYGQPRPEELPYGTAEWWRAMDHEDRGGASR